MSQGGNQTAVLLTSRVCALFAQRRFQSERMLVWTSPEKLSGFYHIPMFCFVCNGLQDGGVVATRVQGKPSHNTSARPSDQGITTAVVTERSLSLLTTGNELWAGNPDNPK